VVLIDNFRNRVFVLDAFQNFVTFLGMLLQDVIFVIGDLARPAEELRGHVDFSDIVEHTRRMHGADTFIAEIHFGGDRLGQAGYPLLVACGIGVPDFHGRGKRAGGFIQNAPQRDSRADVDDGSLVIDEIAPIIENGPDIHGYRQFAPILSVEFRLKSLHIPVGLKNPDQFFPAGRIDIQVFRTGRRRNVFFGGGIAQQRHQGGVDHGAFALQGGLKNALKGALDNVAVSVFAFF